MFVLFKADTSINDWIISQLTTGDSAGQNAKFTSISKQKYYNLRKL